MLVKTSNAGDATHRLPSPPLFTDRAFDARLRITHRCIIHSSSVFRISIWNYIELIRHFCSRKFITDVDM